jgi:hypothetical protein
MPVPAQRDPDLTRDILAKWLGDPARLPGARITGLQTPEFSGFSSETLMVDVECGDAAAALAVRVAPLHYKVFDCKRMAQTGRWAGSITVDNETLEVTLVLPVHLMVGTGYGLEPDWRHGMYQGPDLVVQGVGYDLSRPEDAARMWGMVDAVGRFAYDGQTGYGLYEYWALGDHPSFR